MTSGPRWPWLPAYLRFCSPLGVLSPCCPVVLFGLSGHSLSFFCSVMCSCCFPSLILWSSCCAPVLLWSFCPAAVVLFVFRGRGWGCDCPPQQQFLPTKLLAGMILSLCHKQFNIRNMFCLFAQHIGIMPDSTLFCSQQEMKSLWTLVTPRRCR